MPTYQPHNLKVGDQCWLIIGGDEKPGPNGQAANIHRATVTEIHPKNGYTVERPAWEDSVFDKRQTGEMAPEYYDEIEVSGLSANEGEFSDKVVVEGEGNGRATLCQLDVGFRDGGYNDMVDMRKLNDAELCYNLRVRCINKIPYCRCGVTLVAINLYEPISSYKVGGANAHIYSEATKSKYKAQVSRDKEEPHAWSLASHCYKRVFERPPAGSSGSNNDQSIVITGESGSGKTFNTKQMLDFLADIGSYGEQDPNEQKITDLMLDATPILEGFGNGNMPRNPDSSRFGKLYKIFLDKKDKTITGCSITPYMLEKSRVSSQQMNERNFHIFYRMIHPAQPFTGDEEDFAKQQQKAIMFDGNMMGFSPEERARYHIQEYEDYVYLKGGTAQLENDYERIYGDVPKGWKALPDERGEGEPEGREYKDAKNMAETKMALSKFFTEEQIDLIWRVTAGALWLGNIEYDGDKDKCNPRDSGVSAQALDYVSELWQVDRQQLYDAMYIETLTIVGKEKPCPRGLVQALTLRDSMARTVYERLFVWMIEKMSEALTTRDPRCKPASQPFIGVLDIFGFEFYPDEALKPLGGKTMNTLDQFNINMCNEVLQGVFVSVIFDLEQALYEEQVHEKIEIDFDVNDDTIDIMKHRKNSIIDAMDQVINKKKSGFDGDKEFYQNLEKMWKDKRNKYGRRQNIASYRLDMQDHKGRKEYHFGGPYGYDPASKNVPRELANETPGFFRLQHYAANVTYDVRNWIDRDMDKLSSDSYKCLTGSKLCDFMVPAFKAAADSAAKTTVARDFASSLEQLKDTLGRTECNFVRCLKASNPLASSVFKNALVLNQLKYTGMLDTLIIRRGGFPVRMEFQDFCDQYRVIAVNEAENAHTLAEALKGRTESILSRLEEKPPASQQSDPIRVGSPKRAATAPLVLMRDWFARELDEEANIVKGKSAVIAQAATRMGFARYSYRRQIGARDIQACLRAAAAHAPFATFRKCVLGCLPEARALIARAVSSQAHEQNLSASNKAATIAFLNENVALERREAEERQQARTEDDYATLISFARFGERIVGLKADAMHDAETAYRQAIERIAIVNEEVDSLAAKSVELDIRWQKMIEGGTIRSVPLVRQYKANAQFTTPPTKDAYKYRYSFTYKGSADPPKQEAPAKAPAKKAPAKAPAKKAPAKKAPAKAPAKKSFMEQVEDAVEDVVDDLK